MPEGSSEEAAPPPAGASSMSRFKAGFQRVLRERRIGRIRLFPGPDATAVAIAILVGVLAGAANLGFRTVLEGARYFFWDIFGGRVLHLRLGDYTGNFFLIPLVPLLGMTLLVLLDKLFPGEVKGYGLPKFLELVNLRGGYLKRRWIVLKTIATAFTLGSGMSAGVEGPIVQIGGAIGSTVSRYLRTSAAQLKVLIACGAGAAISATFGAPITGVVFAQEIVLLGEYQLRTFGLIVISSASAMVFNHWMHLTENSLIVPKYQWRYDHELALHLFMGVLLGLMAVLYIRVVYSARDRFERWQVPEWLKPLTGALMVGLIAIILPWVTGNGYDTVNAIYRSQHWLGGVLLAIAFAKLLATGITLGSGGTGGVFAPALVIGSTFGAGFAHIVNQIHPGTIRQPGTFAEVGMGAMLGAATHAPLTSIFLLMETTGDYNVVLPIMFATVAGVLVARSLEPESIDTYDLARRGIHLHEGHEASVLKSLYVGAFYSREFQPVPISMPLEDFLHYLPASRFSYFPVVDDDGKLAGVLSSQDVRTVLFERDVWPLLVVGDVATTSALITVTPKKTLHEALHLFGRQGLDQILVVDEEDPRKVLGFLSRQAILDAYQKGIMAREIGEERAKSGAAD